jgi:hypothetical protein
MVVASGTNTVGNVRLGEDWYQGVELHVVAVAGVVVQSREEPEGAFLRKLGDMLAARACVHSQVIWCGKRGKG